MTDAFRPFDISTSPQDWLSAIRQWSRAGTSGATLGLSPISLQLAMTDWWLHWVSSPEAQLDWLEQYRQSWLKQPGDEASPDHRFAHPAWKQWPFDQLRQHYEQVAPLLAGLSRLDGMLPHHQQLVRFVMNQWLDSISPSNWLATNPQVQQEGLNSMGAIYLKGWHLLLEDLKAQSQAWGQGAQAQEALPPLTHEVGRAVAVTPGRVVFRNELVELIQYEPTTAQVHREPLLIVPSCIMKYYILDLSPHNSMVKYLVDQGFTVFMISWRNPDSAQRDLGLDDYVQSGLLDSMASIRAQTKATRIHAMGYCLGGTFLSMAAALLAQKRQHPGEWARYPELATLTLLAAETDFSEPGDLGVFIDQDQIKGLRETMDRTGYLSGKQMAAAFQLLGARDLIWGRYTRRYLLGESDTGMDLMSWNADATRLPARMHSEYLNELFLKNSLSRGHCHVLGHSIALIDIAAPLLVVGTDKDHVSPWKSVYKIFLQTETDQTFILASGGHNAGIVSEPGHPHRHYWMRHADAGSGWLEPEAWMQQAKKTEGSWWPAWADWMASHADGLVRARKVPQVKGLPAAPGDYVMVRYGD
jgi:polyhydroxyalkanoate synthase